MLGGMLGLLGTPLNTSFPTPMSTHVRKVQRQLRATQQRWQENSPPVEAKKALCRHWMEKLRCLIAQRDTPPSKGGYHLCQKVGYKSQAFLGFVHAVPSRAAN